MWGLVPQGSQSISGSKIYKYRLGHGAQVFNILA